MYDMQTTVSFPGLGIDEFTVSRVAFSIFGKDIFWYGVIISIGVVVAFLHAYWRSKEEKVKFDHLLDLAIFIILFGVLGARLYYVATTWSGGQYKNIIDVFAVWEGGLAIYGGIIAGGLAIVGVCLVKKINVFRVLDMVGPGVMIAQAIGRWANFINGEAYGYEVAAGSPLYFLRMGIISDFAGSEMKYYHPTFLYESLWNVVGFVLITVFYRKKKFHGQNALAYLAWYGFGRMFIEGLRTDSLYLGNTDIRISQLVGFLCFVIAGGLLVAGLILAPKRKLCGVMGGKLVEDLVNCPNQDTETYEAFKAQENDPENQETSVETAEETTKDPNESEESSNG